MSERVFKIHLILIGLLLSGHVAVSAAFLVGGHGHLLGLSEKLDLNEETSVANFFSAAALLVAAAVAATIARTSYNRKSKSAGGWSIATGVLLFMAFDEGSGLHELLAMPVQYIFQTSGFLFIGWVIPYVLLTCFVAYKLFPLALSLSARTRLRLSVASGVYVVGAIGFEMLESKLMHSMTAGSLATVDFATVNSSLEMIVLSTIQEILEMVGVALALRALLIHLTQELGVTVFAGDTLVAEHALARDAQRQPESAGPLAGKEWPQRS